MAKIKPIKPFKNLEEEANFWDTHDVSKIFSDSKVPLSKLLTLRSKKEVVMTIRVQKFVKDRIEGLARMKGINPATLSRMWLIEKLTELENSKKPTV